MRNKYASTCYRCNKRVEPGAGHFERGERGWKTIHAECVFEQRDDKTLRLLALRKRIDPEYKITPQEQDALRRVAERDADNEGAA